MLVSQGTIVINASIIYFDLVVSMFNLWLITMYIDRFRNVEMI